VGQHGMPGTLRARPRRWAMWRPTSWVPRPTRSGRRERRRQKTTARRLAAWSASGSAPNSPTRSETLCSTTSGCATRCAGLRSTADAARSRRPPHRHRAHARSLPAPRVKLNGTDGAFVREQSAAGSESCDLLESGSSMTNGTWPLAWPTWRAISEPHPASLRPSRPPARRVASELQVATSAVAG
jgi:hypothetical protein